MLDINFSLARLIVFNPPDTPSEGRQTLISQKGAKGPGCFLSLFKIKKSGFERQTVDFTLPTTAPHAFTPSRTVNN